MKLMCLDEHGTVTHHQRTDLPNFIREHDVIVANDAATLPASLEAVHARTGSGIEIRLAGRRTLASDEVSRFTAVVFGTGDFRTPTEKRPQPPELRPGDALIAGPLRARIVVVHAHPRLVDVEFDHDPARIWEGLADHGRAIQYAYVPEPLAIWDTWTRIASQPVAFEAPSAGFVLDWAMLRSIRARGARFATVTHAAGLSSTGDPELDRLLPFDEPYVIPQSTAALIATARHLGGRVIAVGTTVVRSLEDAAAAHGLVAARDGLATGRIASGTALRVVDAIVSGLHEPGASHYELLRAFQSDCALRRMSTEAEEHGYLTHEFGDAVFVARDGREPSRPHREVAALSARTTRASAAQAASPGTPGCP